MLYIGYSILVHGQNGTPFGTTSVKMVPPLVAQVSKWHHYIYTNSASREPKAVLAALCRAKMHNHDISINLGKEAPKMANNDSPVGSKALVHVPTQPTSAATVFKALMKNPQSFNFNTHNNWQAFDTMNIPLYPLIFTNSMSQMPANVLPSTPLFASDIHTLSSTYTPYYSQVPTFSKEINVLSEYSTYFYFPTRPFT